MSNLEEKIIETVDEFITEIKTKYPGTKTFINRRYKFFKKKLESVIPEAIENYESVQMNSQVNIIYIIFFISRLG